MFEKMVEEAIPSGFNPNPSDHGSNLPPPLRKKRNLPGNPDPEAEVIALSPKTLMATNRFLCEICGKGFQRDQNLQLHRRGHNLPWKLKQRTSKEIRKRAYVCPEKTCVHHHPSRALGDLTGIKKHFCRKHGEKKWKCDKCSKRYAVQSDWKAHSKTCGTREYKCDCGTIFSRRDSFITHRAFCDALAEESARVAAASNINTTTMATPNNISYHFIGAQMGPTMMAQNFSPIFIPTSTKNDENLTPNKQLPLPVWIGNSNFQEIPHQMGDPVAPYHNPPPSDYQMNWVFGNKIGSGNTEEMTSIAIPSLYEIGIHNQSQQIASANTSATALLQKAAQIGATSSFNQGQDGNKFCGLMYGANPSITTSVGSEVESGGNDLSNFNQFQMYPSKRRNIQKEESVAAGGQTRDFLGVGVQSLCHPSSVNGWI